MQHLVSTGYPADGGDAAPQVVDDADDAGSSANEVIEVESSDAEAEHSGSEDSASEPEGEPEDEAQPQSLESGTSWVDYCAFLYFFLGVFRCCWNHHFGEPDGAFHGAVTYERFFITKIDRNQRGSALI